MVHGVEIHIKVQHSPLHFPSLKRLKLGVETVDSVVAFLSACPVLETLDINFFLEDISFKHCLHQSQFHFKFDIYPHDIHIGHRWQLS